MVGTHSGDMIGEVALAIEMGADAIDIGYRRDDLPACDAGGRHRLGGTSGTRKLYGCAASA